LQLILLNLGGARPDAIDMSGAGESGQFSYCIAENEKEIRGIPSMSRPGWHASKAQVSLLAAEAPPE